MRYLCATTKAGVNAANTIMWQLRAAASDSLFIVEIKLSVVTAPTTGPDWRLVKAATIGTSSATVTPQLGEQGTDAATSRLDTAWSANPTLAAVDLDGYTTPASIGSGIVFTFYDKPLPIPVSSGLLVVNGNAAGATLGLFRIAVKLEE